MYKVMLVDDETGVRNGIKAKINWEAAGFRIESEAGSGEEALRLLAERPPPDLVISDIRMPQMDGITFIKACNERYPAIRTVVLSGYSDFEYTKAAIQLGVKDYLLKPVVRSELQELLSRIAVELEQDRHQKQKRLQEQMNSRQQLRILQEQLLLQLVSSELFSLSAVKERLYQLQMSALAAEDRRAQIVAAEMRVPYGRLDEWSDRVDLLQLSYQMLCREEAERWPRIVPFHDVSRPAMMHFLVMLDGEDENDGAALAFAKALRHHVRRYLRLDCVVGVGEPVRGLKQLKNAYASSMLSWSQSTVHDTVRDGERAALESTYALTPELEKQIASALEHADLHAFRQHLRALFPEHRDTPMFAFASLTFRLLLLFASVAKKFHTGDASLQQHLLQCQMTVWEHRSREDILEQLRSLAQRVMDAVKKAKDAGGSALAEAVRKYVDENYSYELTLSALADLFHLNENYLSGLFKQNAGITFSEYVTKLRMTKAAQLLVESDLKLTDIATLVGYSSSSYFSTSFRKFYGMSPKEYRETMAGETQPGETQRPTE
ncbi:helix-turn-helix domain-containing protein [Paenibacillus sp.]|uniref:helix-turn-helix domain-containing protein n=1 Tax=Paenibacillus sp. TaxID=58172 RepID=UPI002D408892|nr:helix-turn-helix domain-containing protein [Paenibacillus sp.]HZG85824.1 helix-turn-helix domain-containing protein [Paenibacillus sp.]